MKAQERKLENNKICLEQKNVLIDSINMYWAFPVFQAMI